LEEPEDEEMSEEVAKPTPRATGRTKRERPADMVEASPEVASKKMKIDHDA
jgi:hypothetical protein